MFWRNQPFALQNLKHFLFLFYKQAKKSLLYMTPSGVAREGEAIAPLKRSLPPYCAPVKNFSIVFKTTLQLLFSNL